MFACPLSAFSLPGHVLENRTQVIKAIYGRLPHRSVWYIVASSHYEVTHHNTYEDVSLAIAPIITDPDLSAVFRDYPEYQGRELRKKASLFLYSTFLTPENPDKGVGKLVFRLLGTTCNTAKRCGTKNRKQNLLATVACGMRSSVSDDRIPHETLTNKLQFLFHNSYFMYMRYMIIYRALY